MANPNTCKRGAALVLAALTLAASPSAFTQTIQMADLASAPALDGDAGDWSDVSGTTIALKNTSPEGTSKIESVTIKGGVHGDDVYLLLTWSDSSHDIQHKPFVWDAAAKKYAKGKQQEDRLAIQFLMSGDYSTDWLSGKTYEADMWHWKAFRSNTLGLVHDKMTIIGSEQQKKAYSAQARNGSTVFIKRPGDAGDKLYKTKRYSKNEGDVVPKYILADNPQGSIADIKAKGVWKDGQWTLELKRKLDTGNSDDKAFSRGESVLGGIAVFDHSGNEDHNYSETLTFQF